MQSSTRLTCKRNSRKVSLKMKRAGIQALWGLLLLSHTVQAIFQCMLRVLEVLTSWLGSSTEEPLIYCENVSTVNVLQLTVQVLEACTGKRGSGRLLMVGERSTWPSVCYNRDAAVSPARLVRGLPSLCRQHYRRHGGCAWCT